MKDNIRQYIEEALEEIKGAIDRSEISREEVEQAFLDMLD